MPSWTLFDCGQISIEIETDSYKLLTKLKIVSFHATQQNAFHSFLLEVTFCFPFPFFTLEVKTHGHNPVVEQS